MEVNACFYVFFKKIISNLAMACSSIAATVTGCTDAKDLSKEHCVNEIRRLIRAHIELFDA